MSSSTPTRTASRCFPTPKRFVHSHRRMHVKPIRHTDDTTVVCVQFLVYASKCIAVTTFCSVFSYVTWISVDKTPSRCGWPTTSARTRYWCTYLKNTTWWALMFCHMITMCQTSVRLYSHAQICSRSTCNRQLVISCNIKFV